MQREKATTRRSRRGKRTKDAKIDAKNPWEVNVPRELLGHSDLTPSEKIVLIWALDRACYEPKKPDDSARAIAKKVGLKSETTRKIRKSLEHKGWLVSDGSVDGRRGGKVRKVAPSPLADGLIAARGKKSFIKTTWAAIGTPDLTPRARLVLLALQDVREGARTRGKGDVLWAAQRHIGGKVGLGVKAVRAALQELQGMARLSMKPRDNNTTLVYLHDEFIDHSLSAAVAKVDQRHASSRREGEELVDLLSGQGVTIELCEYGLITGHPGEPSKLGCRTCGADPRGVTADGKPWGGVHYDPAHRVTVTSALEAFDNPFEEGVWKCISELLWHRSEEWRSYIEDQAMEEFKLLHQRACARARAHFAKVEATSARRPGGSARGPETREEIHAKIRVTLANSRVDTGTGGPQVPAREGRPTGTGGPTYRHGRADLPAQTAQELAPRPSTPGARHDQKKGVVVVPTIAGVSTPANARAGAGAREGKAKLIEGRIRKLHDRPPPPPEPDQLRLMVKSLIGTWLANQYTTALERLTPEQAQELRSRLQTEVSHNGTPIDRLEPVLRETLERLVPTAPLPAEGSTADPADPKLETAPLRLDESRRTGSDDIPF